MKHTYIHTHIQHSPLYIDMYLIQIALWPLGTCTVSIPRYLSTHFFNEQKITILYPTSKKDDDIPACYELCSDVTIFSRKMMTSLLWIMQWCHHLSKKDDDITLKFITGRDVSENKKEVVETLACTV